MSRPTRWQSRLRRRHRRRADHRRRGLRRRLQHHAGALHAFAMKSQIWLLDPRPNLPPSSTWWSTASSCPRPANTPVMLELRIRACHVHGRFHAKDNRAPAFTLKDALDNPSRDDSRIVLPPADVSCTSRRRSKSAGRPRSDFIAEHELERISGRRRRRRRHHPAGRPVQHAAARLELLGLPTRLATTEAAALCAECHLSAGRRGDRAVLRRQARRADGRGRPAGFIEQTSQFGILHQARCAAHASSARTCCRMAGEYTGEVLKRGLARVPRSAARRRARSLQSPPRTGSPKRRSCRPSKSWRSLVPQRPSGFARAARSGRFFTAMKLVERETRRAARQLRTSAAICFQSCRPSTSATPPWAMGSARPAPPLSVRTSSKRAIAVMGDGGFWHNGLTSGIGNAVFNQAR